MQCPKYSGAFLQVRPTFQKIIFILLTVLCLSGFISPPIALLLGLVVANLSGHPFLELNHKATTILLPFSNWTWLWNEC